MATSLGIYPVKKALLNASDITILNKVRNQPLTIGNSKKINSKYLRSFVAKNENAGN